MLKRFTPTRTLSVLLACSVIANIILLAGIDQLANRFRYLYIDYRHFRSLPIGISDATRAQPVADSRKAVFFGDSRVETWAPLPALDGFDIINAGVVGETTVEMRRRWQTDVLRLQPDIVVIQAGVNDLTAAATRDIPEPDALSGRMLENMDFFLSQMDKQQIPVVLFSIIPTARFNLLRRYFWSPSLAQLVEDSNAELALLAAKHNAKWVDVTGEFLDTNKQPHAALFADTLHLTDAGYQVLNKTLLDAVNKLDIAASDSDQ